MRVLIDECLNWRLGRALRGHFCTSVQRMGWSGIKNGELLDKMRQERFDVFITGLSCIRKEATISASLALARRADANDVPMKKGSKKNRSDMQAEYDFSRAVRGKYARRYAEGTNVVVLDPDVAKTVSECGGCEQLLA